MATIEDIMVESGLIEKAFLDAQVQAAVFFGFCPGKMIVGARQISDELLVLCYKLLPLVNNKEICLAEAGLVVRIVIEGKYSLDCALNMVTGKVPAYTSKCFGAFLVTAGLLTELQLIGAMISSARLKSALAQTLIKSRLVESSTVLLALELQFCMEQKSMPVNLALAYMKTGTRGHRQKAA